MKKLLTFAMATGVALTLSSGAMAVTADGTLGATSTGTADVTLTISEQLQISDMDAFVLGTYTGTGDLDGNDDICVYNNGDGSYRITITNDAVNVTADAFAVEDAADAARIPMTVAWNDETGTAGEVAATHGVAITPQSGANNETTDCSTGGLSGNLHVTLAEADLQAASAGAYDSELTLLVEPD